MKNILLKLSILPFLFTVSSCKKAEGTGSVNIKVTFDVTGGCEREMEIGLGYSSGDTENESYFERGSSKASPYTFSSSQLKPGTYYYKAKASSTVRYSHCTTPSIKSGAIIVKDGEDLNLSVSL